MLVPVPGLGQFPLITYTTLIGTSDFVTGSLPPGYQATSPITSRAFSVDVVITNSLAKTDVCGEETSTATGTPARWNWVSSGNPSSFQQGDMVTFDETLTGTPTYNLTTTLFPASVFGG